jgi:Domain of unknown function (DUF4926)
VTINTFELFDNVVYSGPDRESGVKAGEIGAILEVYGNDYYEVEFSDADGTTIELAALSANQLVKWVR